MPRAKESDGKTMRQQGREGMPADERADRDPPDLLGADDADVDDTTCAAEQIPASAERIGMLILDQVEPPPRQRNAPSARTKADGGAS